jgi:hypothetical protein
MRTFKLAPALLLMLFGANVNAWAQSIPNWIHPNIVVEYNQYSQYEGSPPRQLEVFNTITVTEVSDTAVSGTIHSVTSLGVDLGTSTFSCSASESCTNFDGLFWVDPGDPVTSEFGPNAGSICTNRGTAPYTVAGATWTAVTVVCLPPGTGGEEIITISDAYSGLILEHTEHIPALSQDVISFLYDLAGANLPATLRITRPSDFYGTGTSDILWQNDSGQADIWEMNGTSVIGGGSLGNPGVSWHVVTTGDFNRDGHADILWQNNSGEAYIWEMNGTSVIGAGSPGNPGPSWHAIATGDFNGDGYSDILWQNNSGEAYIWEMNGTTVIGGGSPGNPGPSWHAIATGDFNGDGHSDILWQNDSGEVYIWEMNGTTVIGGGSPGNPGPSWHAIATGDFYHNGYSDILWQNDSGEVYIWEMNGTKVVGGGSLGNPGSSWHVIGTGDYYGNGYSDILFQNVSGEVYIWEMNGTSVIGGGSLGNPGPSWHVK